MCADLAAHFRTPTDAVSGAPRLKKRHFCKVGSPWFAQSKESNFLKSGIVPEGKIFETRATAVVTKEVAESYKSCA